MLSRYLVILLLVIMVWSWKSVSVNTEPIASIATQNISNFIEKNIFSSREDFPSDSGFKHVWSTVIFTEPDNISVPVLEKHSEYEQLFQMMNSPEDSTFIDGESEISVNEIERLHGADSDPPLFAEYAPVAVSGVFRKKSARSVMRSPARNNENVRVYTEMTPLGLAECREATEICYPDGWIEKPCLIERHTIIPILTSLKYRGGNGRSYSEGFESSGLFLAYHHLDSRNYPFIDLRVLRVDKGKLAGNAGIGWRVFSATHEEMFGANVYYDYRRITNADLHQLGLGIELLGKYWDIRGNGYIPLANQRGKIENLSATFTGGFTASNERYEKGMWGLDVEIGRHLCCTKCIEIYNAIGPYFYGTSDCCGSILGGMGRIYLEYKKWLKLQFFITHDQTYDTQAQGEITFTLSSPCSKRFRNCFYKPVERNNIILTEKFCTGWQTNY